MISPMFYNESRLVSYFADKKLLHYPIKDKVRVLTKTPYVIKEGDTLYSIAGSWFGSDKEYYWTIISDLNGYITNEELIVGDTLYLPLTIFAEQLENNTSYEQGSSTAIKI